MMECTFDREMLALYDADDITRQQVCEHITECSVCAQIVDQYRTNANLLSQSFSRTEYKPKKIGEKRMSKIGRGLAAAALLILLFSTIAAGPAIAHFAKTFGLLGMVRSGEVPSNMFFPISGPDTGLFPVEGPEDRPSGEIRWHRDNREGTYVSLETEDENEAQEFIGQELGLPTSWSGTLSVYRYNDEEGKLLSWGVSHSSMSLNYARDFIGTEVALPASINGTEILLSKRLGSDGQLLEAHVAAVELGYWAAYRHDGAPNDIIEFSSDMTVHTEEHTLEGGHTALLILSETPTHERTDILLVRDGNWLYGVLALNGVQNDADIDHLLELMESRRP